MNVVTPKCTMVVEGDIDVKKRRHHRHKSRWKDYDVAEGQGAHGSTPEKGGQCGSETFRSSKRRGNRRRCGRHDPLHPGKDWNRDKRQVSGYLLTDEETGETTVNLGVVKCTDQELFFTLDIRYPKNGDRDTLVANVKKHAEEYGLTAEVGSEGKLLYVPKDFRAHSEADECIQRRDRKRRAADRHRRRYIRKGIQQHGCVRTDIPGRADVIHQPNECGDVQQKMLFLPDSGGGKCTKIARK